METCLFYNDIALKKLLLLYEVFQNVTDLFTPSVSSKLQVGIGLNDIGGDEHGTTLKDAAFLADIQNFSASVKKLLNTTKTKQNGDLCEEQSKLVTEIYELLQLVENYSLWSHKVNCVEIEVMLKKIYELLLLWDRRDVHKIEFMAKDLNDKLSTLCKCKSASDVLASLKILCEFLEKFIKCLHQRQSEVGHSQEIVTLRATLLKQCLENIAQSKKFQMEYGDSSSFSRSVIFWSHRFSCLTYELKVETEDSGKFLHSLQQLSWAFSDEERALLVEETVEQLSRDVVVQGMAIAHASSPLLQGRISESCQRLLRLVNDDQPAVPDELTTLEKLVNMSVLRQVIEAFLNSAKPLDDLLKDAATDESTTEFHRRADLIYQVSRFVACCCTADPSYIFLHLRCMEAIDVELVPSVVTYAANSTDPGNIYHITLLYQEWGRQLKNLSKCVFAMTDAKEMMKLMKASIQQEIENILDTINEFDLNNLKALIGYGELISLLPLTWMTDTARDSLKLGFRALKAIGRTLSKNPTNPQLQDSLKKRLKAMLNCVIKALDAKSAQVSASNLFRTSKPGISIREVKLNATVNSLLFDLQRLQIRISALEKEVASQFTGNASLLDVLVNMCRTLGELANDLSNVRKVKLLLAATQNLISFVKTVEPVEVGASMLERLEVLFGELCVLVTATKSGDKNQHKACCLTLFSMVSLVVHMLAVCVSAGILKRKDAHSSSAWLKKFQCWDLNVTCAQNGTSV